MLRPEDVGWREDIGAVAVLDGALLDADGRLDLDRVRRTVEGHLHRVPRFRQVLRTPPWWLGGPLWIDAPDFAIEDHVRSRPLPPGSGEPELLDAVERLRARPFNPDRPRWELWLLPGLTGGHVGLYVKIHHAMADGVAGVATLAALLDLDPGAPTGPRLPWTPAAAPTAAALLADHLGRLGASAAAMASGLVHPVRSAAALRTFAGVMRRTFGQSPTSATSLNRRVGSGRRVVPVRGRLDVMKAAGHAHGATVNDVLLAAVTGGLRALLLARGETVDDLVLRASVPVSFHGEGPVTRQNDVGTMFVPLPVGEADPRVALARIGRETGARKHEAYQVNPGPLAGSRFLQDLVWSRFDRQRWATLGVADVPGPTVPLYLAGARLLEVFPIVPLFGNLTLGVGALSYAGGFAITVVADRDTCPDVDVFAAGLRATLDALAPDDAAVLDLSPVAGPGTRRARGTPATRSP